MDAVQSDTLSLWTIETGLDFSRELAHGILARYGGHGAAADGSLGPLADVVIYLPNRRAVAAVQIAFLRALDAQAMLLPQLKVLGDTAEESGFGQIAAPMDAVASSAERLTLLCQLINRWQREMDPKPAPTPSHVLKLAQSLATLLDRAQTEGLDFTELETLVPEAFAEHWQRVLGFLTIVTERWPAILAEQGKSDGAARRHQQVMDQARRWTEAPPKHPVIVAGSTGSIPATAHLMDCVARLPEGHVVLPGLDREMPLEAWDAIPHSHPQGALKRYLDRQGQSPAHVKDWTGKKPSALLERRLASVRAAMAPARFFGAEPREPGRQPCPGLSLVEAESDWAEANAIGLIMRETLETPEKEAALITPDRRLARQVITVLKRWGITVNDSAGKPLSATPAGQFFLLVAEFLSNEAAPVSLLSLFKHPLFQAGALRSEVLAAARKLDQHALRGVRTRGGLAALHSKLAKPEHRALLSFLEGHLASWPKEPRSFTDFLEIHIAIAEACARGPDTKSLFSGQDGNALAHWARDTATLGYDGIAPKDYLAFVKTLLASGVVREGGPVHPRLTILGTIEARMVRPDVSILGGLNEGVWPPAPGQDPWMNETMRKEFGLPPLERRVGLSAHDFMQACGAETVWLTRTTKRDGAPTQASRWVARLKAAYGNQLDTGANITRWAHILDHPETYKPFAQPRPAPATALRPKSFSVSDVELLMRDPYSLYAKRILKLKPLEPLDADPGARERGTLIHEALEAFFKRYPDTLPPDALSHLIGEGEAVFKDFRDRPGIYALWWPRFLDMADWVIAEQDALLKTGRTVAALERKGSMPRPGGYEVHAIADRIDRTASGGLVILDYKTGSAPSKKNLENGMAPQLPLEAVMADAGAFSGLSEPVEAVEVWSLSTTGSKGAQRTPLADFQSHADAAHEGLLALFAAFDAQETAYLHAPSPAYAAFGDYDDLVREAEWRGIPEAAFNIGGKSR